MTRHAFDSVSFFFGALFVALAAWALFADELDALDRRWVWPGLLLLAGVALIAPLFTHREDDGTDELGERAESESDSASLEAAKAELPDDPFNAD